MGEHVKRGIPDDHPIELRCVNGREYCGTCHRPVEGSRAQRAMRHVKPRTKGERDGAWSRRGRRPAPKLREITGSGG